MKARRVISWLAGAALYVFVFWIIGSFVGRNDIVSWLFVGIALVLVARQLRRRRSSIQLGVAGGAKR